MSPSYYAPLERGDIPYLLRMTRENMSQIILSSWGLEWKDETLLETLLDQGLVTEVLKCDDRIVGYYCLDQRGDYLFVVSIQVARDQQRTGVGRGMMERIEELAGRSGLEGVELCVQSTNLTAKGFYEHMGYRLVSRERNNLIMRKHIGLEA
ncbi:MAG: GNAT family N-acetyltransferase [Methanomassiliicoccales archaeon]|jgi:ribosomal protein S18 acetylase RimI-like enzyme|nr:GNAT family N-acetyltransferase [Methanomassiliicoccales archaeon]MDD1755332.1 GNAT family N-acetyltransferase [Methanomassiliicoccales archaeon]